MLASYRAKDMVNGVSCRLRRPARRLAPDERGNAIALFALALPMLIGAVGLAVDTSRWILLKRQLQQVADSAAMAGSMTAIQGGDIDLAIDADAARSRQLIGAMTLSGKSSPDGHLGDPNAVEVLVSAPVGLSFASMFMVKPLVVTASATATMIETNDFCAFALDTSSNNGILIDPNSTIEADCGIAANSPAADAVRGDASSKFASTKLFAVGGIIGSDALASPHARAYSLRQKDPGADLKMPDIPNSGCPNITVNPNEDQSLNLKPGCFGNLMLNGKVTLQPGAYVLNRGNISVGPKAEVNCTGCTFIMTSEDAQTAPKSIGHVRIDSSASVQLSAPTEGDYAGLLMIQDRRAAPEDDSDENVIAGNSQSKVDGLLYFPSQRLKLDGRGSPDLRCARVVGKTLVLAGRVLMAKSCSADNGKIRMKGAEVRLVG